MGMPVLKNDRLGEAVILSTGMPMPAQWTCRRRRRDAYNTYTALGHGPHDATARSRKGPGASGLARLGGGVAVVGVADRRVSIWVVTAGDVVHDRAGRHLVARQEAARDHRAINEREHAARHILICRCLDHA